MFRKFMSILMSFVMLATITAGIDMSAYAKNSAGVISIPSSSSFNPLANEYIIDAQSSQFDFFENYSSVEALKAWGKGKDDNGNRVPFCPNKDIYEVYAEKLGITNKGLKDYEKVAKIYHFMAKTLKSSGSETVNPDTLFITRSGHCEAFSNVFGELCKIAKIETWLIATAGHTWNIVKIDGQYYECDPMSDRVFLGNLQNVIDDYSNKNLYLKITHFEREERYEGIEAVKQWAGKYSSAISTEDYIVPIGGTLDFPKTTATATSEGIVVRWEPVADADWYEVYCANVDGITNDATLTKSDPVTWEKTTIKFNDGDYAYFKFGTSTLNSDGNIVFKSAGKVIHSIDINEEKQYQCFIDGSYLNYYGAILVVVAKNVDGETSVNTRDSKSIADTIGKTPNSKNVVSIDKNTGATVKGTYILKVNEGNLVINNDYDARNHGFSNKVATPITAGIGTQGAEVYECPDCLQRKMVYTKALPCTAHKYETTTAKATTKKNGSVVTKCSVCNKKQSSTTIYSPKTITLSTTSYVYNSKAQKPSVTIKDSKGKALKNGTDYTVSYSNNKNVGKASAKITFKGNYSGTVTKTFTIKPKSTSISKLTAGKKKFTVKWKKQATQTTGYQIQYSTSSKFSNAKTVTISKNKTTSKTISKLSEKKKYYVRIRTYKTVNGKKYYSAWSKVKTVTTKK